MARKPLLPEEKRKQLYIYPQQKYVSALGISESQEIAVTAIETAYNALQKVTATEAKKLQQSSMEDCAKINDEN